LSDVSRKRNHRPRSTRRQLWYGPCTNPRERQSIHFNSSSHFKEETMRLHTTPALLGGLAAIAAMAALNASAQSSGSQSSGRQTPSTQSPGRQTPGTESPSSQSSARQSSSTHAADDSKFLQEAIRGNMAEVKMGELAKERAQSKDVRDYGQMLIDDHSKANEKAMAVARNMSVTAPTEPTAKQKQEHDMMAKLSGSEFDNMFMSHMVQDHQEAIGKYTAQAQSGDSSKATDYAKDTLPTLRSHLSKAQSIESKLSGSERSSSNGRSGSSSDSGSSPTTRPFGSPGSGQPSSTGSNQGRTDADDGTPSSRRAPQ
jgi:putative membrane protein